MTKITFLRLLSLADAAGILALTLAALLACHVIMFDHVHHTYGISFGLSDTRYCSLELNLPGPGAHGGGLDEWCQSGD
jgi:hypothetical protein